MEVSSKFEACFFELKCHKIFIFLCGLVREEGRGGSETLTTKIRQAGPKHFVDIPLQELTIHDHES